MPIFLKIFSSVFISTFCLNLHAADCKSWLQHLSLEHHVSVISNNGVKASNFKYIEIPNSPYRLAIPLNEVKNWKVETEVLKAGSVFTVYNQAFGFSAEFDQAGTCLNSTGFVYDQMDRDTPQSLKGKVLELNYDWKSCEQVKDILNKNKLSVDQKNSIQVAASLKKSNSQDYAILEKFSKTAGSSALHQIQSSSVESLLSVCNRQTQYLEMTVGSSPVKSKKSSQVAQ